MTWRYNPSLSSTDYLEMAARRRNGLRKTDAADFKYLDRFSYGVHEETVSRLLNPENWSEQVHLENRRPRVFVDTRINQAGNLSVRWARGAHSIFFPMDFEFRMLQGTADGFIAGERSNGELMWVQGFRERIWRARQDTPGATVEKALLFGYKARLDELISKLSTTVDVIGAITLEFVYMGNRLADVGLEPTISEQRLHELWTVSQALRMGPE